MEPINITSNSYPIKYIPIDLSSHFWNTLHIDNLKPFIVQEPRYYCDIYPNGLYPGAYLTDTDQEFQSSKILKFRNFVEFSKIMPDEIKQFNDADHLTSSFFLHRHQGWSSDTIQTKKGEPIGYHFVGEIYSLDKSNNIIQLYASTIYHILISDLPAFKKLKYYLDSGYGLSLSGMDHPYIYYLSLILLK